MFKLLWITVIKVFAWLTMFKLLWIIVTDVFVWLSAIKVLHVKNFDSILILMWLIVSGTLQNRMVMRLSEGMKQ